MTELEQIRSVLREYLALEAECRPSPAAWRQLRLRKRATSLKASHARLGELRARLAAFANAKNEHEALRAAAGAYVQASGTKRQTDRTFLAAASAYAEAHASDAKRPCRACDGDGFLAADSSTPHNERLTRDSRVCTYCDGTGVSRDGAMP